MTRMRERLLEIAGRGRALGWLTAHYKVKIVAFLMALFLWFYVVTENTFQYEIEVPIRVTNLAPDRALAAPLPEKAVVRLEGSGKALIGLMISGDAWLAADFAGVERDRLWKPRPQEVILGRASGQIRVIEVVSPDSVHVSLDVATEKKVPVVPEVDIVPSAGYTVVEGPTVQPESVVVRGARTLIRQVNEVHTAARRYENVHRDIEDQLPLTAIPLLRLEPTQVRIVARLEKLMERSFVQLPVGIANLPPGMRGLVTPPSVDVVVQGGISRVMKLERTDLRAWVDFRSPVGGTNDVFEVKVDTPPGVWVQRVEPTRVRVILEKMRS